MALIELPTAQEKPMATATPPTRATRGLYADRVSMIDTENAFKVGPLIRELEDDGHQVVRCNIGEPDFPLPRQAIAHTMGASRNIRITPDRVVVFPGAKPPIGFTQQTYCNTGDEIIYPSPGFPIYESFVRYIGATAVPMQLEESTGFSTKAVTYRSDTSDGPTAGTETLHPLGFLARVVVHMPAKGYVTARYDG